MVGILAGMKRTLTVLANEFAVTDRRAVNPRAISLGVSPCIGVALMLNDEFNTAAIGHFFVDAQTRDKPRPALKAYVFDGFVQMLDAMGWKPGMKLRAGIVGGKPCPGKEEKSALLSEFVHKALAMIPNTEIVMDRTMTGKAEDIVADCETGDIHALDPDQEISQLLFDHQDHIDWCVGSYNYYWRQMRLHAANDNPAGSQLLVHPFSRPG
jgi:hypothetical protein